MNHTRQTVYRRMMILASVLILSPQVYAQQIPADVMQSPQLQQAIQSGQVTPKQVQEGMKAFQEGKISPEVMRQAQEKAEMGTLTPGEIEAGKRLLEEKQGAAETDSETVPEVIESKETTEKEEPFKSDDDYFKKTDGVSRPVLPIFGHNLFSGTPSTFPPITAMPVSDDYIIGPGDEVRVLMWGRLDSAYAVAVDNEGIINFPKIGPLTVAGLTYGETKELIGQKTEAITGVNVHISMGKLRTIQVFVLGEVRNPGVVTVSSLATIANALLTSGGPTSLGSLRHVQLKRQGQVISTVDFYSFLLKGDTSSDVRLMPTDVVFVPKAGPMVAISGNVRRAAVYELKEDGTLKVALELAGGLTPRAFNQRIQIERASENRFQVVLDISYEEFQRKRPTPLQDGDHVHIFSILPSTVNAVYLYGNVLRPGQYAYKPGLKLRDILPDLESLAVDTHFDYALIKRYRFRDMESELVPFDLGQLLMEGDNTQNMPLMALDEIYVFSKWMFEDRSFATAKGEVRRPGRYLIDDMTIKDLILKSGDLTDNVYLPKGEIIRVDADRRKKTIYFDVSAAMDGDPSHNLRLRDEDQMIIHSIWEEQWRAFVTVRGEVKKADSYVLTEDMDLRDLIFKAGSFTRDAYLTEGHLYRTDLRSKELTIHTFNVKRAMEGDPAHNLLLSDLDEVVIHSIWEFKDKNTVSIQGMVNRPGEYPYAENMTVRDLIFVAGNTRTAAFLKEAEVTRYEIVDGRTVSTSIAAFDVERALRQDPASNLRLQPMDVVNIKEIPEWWDKRRSVTLSGDLLFPGTYTIRKSEMLSDVIERAGGYNDHAYLRGAVFTRESVRVNQQKRIDEMMDRLERNVARMTSEEIQGSLSAEDLASQQTFVASQQALVAKLGRVRASGRIVINLLPLSILKGSSYDIAIEDGDTLFIPQVQGTVSVIGAVYNATALVYDEKRPELKYYLAKTGGPTENAETKQMYIVRANGTVVSKKGSSWLGVSWNDSEERMGFWRNFENSELQPGDTVIVPEKVIHPNYMRDIRDITQILYQIAVTAGATVLLF